MKTFAFCIGVFLLVSVAAQPAHAQDPITMVIKEGIKKAIVAVDLKIQRLQNRTLWLQNAQKALENAMSKAKLTEISDWVERQRKLYDDYFKELYSVKNILVYYHKVKSITSMQMAIVNQYKQMYGQFKADPHFSSHELIYMGQVYTGMLNESLKILERLSLITSSFKTQMTDGKRMEIIDGVFVSIQNIYDDVRIFSKQNIQLSLARSNDEKDVLSVKKLYGIQ